MIRPLRIIVPGAEPDASTRYAQASRIPDREQRWEEMRRLLEAMVDTTEHESWLDYRALLCTLGRLPGPTYDLVRLTPEVPAAAVCALLRSSQLDDLWLGMEELPFLWCCVPLDAWRRGLRHARDQMGPAWAQLSLGQLASDLIRRAPFLSPVVHCLQREFGLKLVEPQRANLGMLAPFANELRIRHAEGAWPRGRFVDRTEAALALWWPGPSYADPMAPALLAPLAAALMVAERAPKRWSEPGQQIGRAHV